MLAVLASVAVGIAMFGTTVFLSQYLQLSRGKTPTESGLLSIPMVIGLFASSTLVGRRISETGRYKHWMMLGGVLLTTGLLLMGTLDETTSLYELGVFMFLIGTGRRHAHAEPRARGAERDPAARHGRRLLADRVLPEPWRRHRRVGARRRARGARHLHDQGGLRGHRRPAEAARSLEGGQVPNLHELPASLARLIEHAYGVGVGEIFLVAAPLSLVALIAVTLLREERLGERSGLQRAAEESRA